MHNKKICKKTETIYRDRDRQTGDAEIANKKAARIKTIQKRKLDKRRLTEKNDVYIYSEPSGLYPLLPSNVSFATSLQNVITY